MVHLVTFERWLESVLPLFGALCVPLRESSCGSISPPRTVCSQIQRPTATRVASAPGLLFRASKQQNVSAGDQAMAKTASVKGSATAAEPPRVKRFRRELIKAIPRFPNDRASLQHMQQKHVTDLLIDYINWRSRYIGQRPRTISIEAAAQADPRWTSRVAAVTAFLDKVRRGDDLTPHLSIEPHTKGYTPAARAPNAPPVDRWWDKDFVLNAMGYHHFHLGTKVQERGHVDRTDDLIFAEVQRDTLNVIAIFSHEVFNPNSSERSRLWSVHDQVFYRSAPPGSVVVPTMIATSGHTVKVVRYAQYCAKVIRDFEPKLDDWNYMATLYPQGQKMSPKPKFAWGFYHLDLLVHEAVAPINLILTRGWN